MKKIISTMILTIMLFNFIRSTLFAQENINAEQLNINEVMSEKINLNDEDTFEKIEKENLKDKYIEQFKNLINKISNKFQKFKNVRMKDLKQYLIKTFGITAAFTGILYYVQIKAYEKGKKKGQRFNA